MRTNSEDLTIDENQGEFLGHSHKTDVLLEESESLEEDEAQTPTQLPFPSQVEDTGGGLEDRSDPTYLAYRWPSVSEGLAESALEDVQNLRQLILRRLLPMRHSDHSEDDHTPTPSVSDGAGYPCEMVTESVTDTLDDGLGEVSPQHSSIAESSRTAEDFAYRHKRQGSKDAEHSMWDMVDSHLKGSSELENQNDQSHTNSED
ncbi:rho guanine nucleotide exchange factor 11-like [Ranitomeya imitator]|uniref:rho guanine nucleotide exchange factor 11-like n=1 Tax=Ranitomeya imitator TaxID=111125 RepID=UPI0037E7E0A5